MSLELFRLVGVIILQMTQFTMFLIPILGKIKFPEKARCERENFIQHNDSKYLNYKKIADLKSRTILNVDLNRYIPVIEIKMPH